MKKLGKFLKIICICLLYSSCSFADKHQDPTQAAGFSANAKTLPHAGTTVTLSPQMRAEPIGASTYSIQTSDVAQNLDNVIIFDSQAAYEAQPRVLDFALDTAYGTSGDLAYVAGISQTDNVSAYTILKQGQNYKNKDTGEYLGMQAIIIGAADVQSYGDPQTIRITKASEPVEIGARLIPRTGLDLPAVIETKIPTVDVRGYVISVKNPKTGVGKGSTLIIGLGSRNGLEFGDILNLKEQPKEIFDKKAKKKSIVGSTSFGEILLYKVMDKVSLGYILSTSRPVVVNDVVSSKP
jgi:hypothetical protein